LGAQEAEAGQETETSAAVDETQFLITDEPLPGEGAVDPEADIPLEEAELTGTALGPGDYLRMLGALLFVVLLMFLFLRWMKKAGKGNLQENEQIRLLGGRSLGGSRALHIIEVGNQTFLIGASDSQVSLISEITDKETQDQLRLNYETEQKPSAPHFARLLWDKLNPASSPSSEVSVEDSSDFIKKQRSRLKDWDQ